MSARSIAGRVLCEYSGMPCVGLDWFVPFFFASNRTGPVHFQTCIGLNRIDPGAALLYYVPDCTGLYRFFLCTGLYRLYYVPVCTGLYRMYRYITGPLGPGYITNRIYEPD